MNKQQLHTECLTILALAPTWALMKHWSKRTCAGLICKGAYPQYVLSRDYGTLMYKQTQNLWQFYCVMKGFNALAVCSVCTGSLLCLCNPTVHHCLSFDFYKSSAALHVTIHSWLGFSFSGNTNKVMCQDLKPDLIIVCIVWVADFSYYLSDAVFCSVREASFHSLDASPPMPVSPVSPSSLSSS